MALDRMEARLAVSEAMKDVEAARLLLAGAMSEQIGLLLEEDGETPVLCEATGLAVFEDDDFYGDPSTGSVVLKEAVAIRDGLPTAEAVDEA